MFSLDTPLAGAPKQLPPTASSPDEAFTAGMFGDTHVSGIHVCTCNLNYQCIGMCYITVYCCFFFRRCSKTAAFHRAQGMYS